MKYVSSSSSMNIAYYEYPMSSNNRLMLESGQESL